MTIDAIGDNGVMISKVESAVFSSLQWLRRVMRTMEDADAHW